MDTPLLLVMLTVGLLITISIWGVLTAKRPSSDPADRLATSTEGMKVCPKCGMGNLWTERRCSACGNSLRG
jgi:uncharacterized protein (DUF983 family)